MRNATPTGPGCRARAWTEGAASGLSVAVAVALAVAAAACDAAPGPTWDAGSEVVDAGDVDASAGDATPRAGDASAVDGAADSVALDVPRSDAGPSDTLSPDDGAPPSPDADGGSEADVDVQGPDAGSCSLPEDCAWLGPGPTPCEVPTCAFGTCTFGQAPPGTPCESELPCLKDTICTVDGACLGSVKVCDDGDPCTEDLCVDGACLAWVPDALAGASCDDGDPCTGGDTCTPAPEGAPPGGGCEGVTLVGLSGCEAGQGCFSPAEILTGVVALDTSLWDAELGPAAALCAGFGPPPEGPDGVAHFTATLEGLYRLRALASPAFDSALTVWDACPGSAGAGAPAGSACLGWADVPGGTDDSLTLALEAGQTVWLVLHGRGPGDAGPGILQAELLGPIESDCGDGIDDDGNGLTDCDDLGCVGSKPCCSECLSAPCGPPVCAEHCETCPPPGPCLVGLCTEMGCQAEPAVAGAPCLDDGDPCTVDTCDGDGGCGHVALPAGTPCTPAGFPCAQGACGEAGGCQPPAAGQAVPMCCAGEGDDGSCDDGAPCTQDSCSAAGVCEHAPEPAGLPCEADGLPCTAGACSGDGVCVEEPDASIGGCCAVSADCDDGLPCTAESCDPASAACVVQPLDALTCCEGDGGCAAGCAGETECDEGLCVPLAPALDDTCCDGLVAAWRFTDGLDGWTALNSDGALLGFQWAQATPGAPGGADGGGLYYGDPSAWDYDFGTSDGLARSPAFAAPAGVGLQVAFLVAADLELIAGQSKDTLTLDLEVWDGTGDTEADWPAVRVWDNAPDGPSPPADGQAVAVALDVSWAAGRTVRLAFRFDTEDPFGNSDPGVWLDDVIVTSGCVPAACETDASCASLLDCAPGQCVDGGCVFAVLAEGVPCGDEDPAGCVVQACDGAGACLASSVAEGTACPDDGDPCTEDVCDGAGACTHAASSGAACCDEDADCATGLPCAPEACVDGTCVADADAADGVGCCGSDGDCPSLACGVDETCVDGACTASVDVACCVTLDVDAWTFASDAEGFTFANSASDGGGHGWQLAADAPGGKAGVLRFGADGADGYDVGGASGTATGPSTPLPVGAVRLTTAVYADIEAATTVDTLELRVVTVGAPALAATVWSRAAAGFQDATWLDVVVDLTPFAGRTVRLAWAFDTVDTGARSGAGVFVDTMSLDADCTAASCAAAGDCALEWPTPFDAVAACAGGACAYLWPATSAD